MRFISSWDFFSHIRECGITAECGVDKSVNTSTTAHVCAFGENKPLCKNAKCDAYTFFVAQTVTIGEQEISPKSN